MKIKQLKTMMILFPLFIGSAWSQFENVPSSAWNFKVLVLTAAQGHAHESMANGKTMMDRLAQRHGFQVDHSTRGSDFTTTNLTQYDVIALNNTTKMQDILGVDQKAAFIDYVEQFSGVDGQSQGGVFGWHGATDLSLGGAGAWPWYVEYIGTAYDGASGGNATVTTDEIIPNTHPTVLGVPSSFSMSEEWYSWFQPVENNPGTVPVLWIEGSGERRPISWIVNDRKAKTVLSGIGHELRHFTDPRIENHFAGSLLYASGYDPDPINPVIKDNSLSDKIIIEGFIITIDADVLHKVEVYDMNGVQLLNKIGSTKMNYKLQEELNPGLHIIKVKARNFINLTKTMVVY